MAKRIVMLSYEGGNLIDVAGPVQVFETANRQVTGPRPYLVTVASAAGGPVVTGTGLAIVTVPLADLDGVAIDTVIAPGGSTDDTAPASPALIAWLQARAAAARRVCSVCTGAFLLGAAGLLEGKRATTHWDYTARLAARFPAVRVECDPIFVRDGTTWTSAGVTAGIDLALALVEEDLGHAVAIAAARDLVMYMKRPGGQSQFSAPLAAQTGADGRFGELHAWMAANLKEDLRVERLAVRAGMSPRTFARAYTARTGRTPARTVELMRLEAARRALEETDRPLKRVAVEVGYGEEQTLRRVFQRRFGVAPSDYRMRFSARRED